MLFLEAINIIIRGSNKAVINDLDDESQAAQVAKRTLKQTRIDMLERGWGFNTRTITLALNADNRVPVAASYLTVQIPDKDLAVQLDESDGKLYVWSHKNNINTWHDAAIEKVKIIFDITNDDDFKKLPQLMAEWIAHKATADFWSEAHDGAVNSKLEAVAIRRQTRWTNTQGDLGNLRGVSGFEAFSGQGQGRHGTFDPRTQSSF